MRLRLALAAMLPLLTLAACGTSTASQEAGPTRTVKHAMGETKVPMTPKRVVVLDTDKLDTMVSLGLTPSARPRPRRASPGRNTWARPWPPPSRWGRSSSSTSRPSWRSSPT
ncbi:hypothetical protein ACFQYP_39390 [Nonomuraea antimicrobica]